MNDHANFEVRVAFRARVLCRTAEPHHAAEARPCHAHTNEARRQLSRPAVASSVPDSFRRGIGADDGAAGLRVLASVVDEGGHGLPSDRADSSEEMAA